MPRLNGEGGGGEGFFPNQDLGRGDRIQLGTGLGIFLDLDEAALPRKIPWMTGV